MGASCGRENQFILKLLYIYSRHLQAFNQWADPNVSKRVTSIVKASRKDSFLL